MRLADFKRGELTDALHDALAAELDSSLHEVCGRLAGCVLAALASAGALKRANRRELANCAVRIVYQVIHSHGGQQHYFPKGLYVGGSDRNRQLIEKFKGNNLRELAREFGLSVVRVRQILAEASAPTRRPRK